MLLRRDAKKQGKRQKSTIARQIANQNDETQIFGRLLIALVFQVKKWQGREMGRRDTVYVTHADGIGGSQGTMLLAKVLK
jgi:hypothetical protein